jgi:hypothetical protein
VNLGPADDRETSIQWHHNERIAHVYTCDERVIARLKKNPVAKLTEVHHDDRGLITGMEFEVPVVNHWPSRAKPGKGRVLSPEAKVAALRRLSRLRGQHGHARVRPS